MKVSIFDFDKTLTKKDTLMPFALYISKRNRQLVKYYIFSLCYLLFKFRIISNKAFKHIFLKFFFNGKPIELIKDLIYGFEKHFIEKNLNAEIYSKFRENIMNNKVIILSSNFDVFLKNISLINDADIIATEVGYDNVKHTYRIKGNVYAGLEKIKVLKTRFGVEIFEDAMFYGDKEDKLVLKVFKRGIKV